MTNNTDGGGTTCVGPGTVDPGLGGNPAPVKLDGTTFSDKQFAFATPLTASFSTLELSSIPAADGGTNSVKIRKIVIAETAPTPVFTLSPTSLNVPCGSTTAQTFTVNNVYNSPGTISYNWNLGSPSNGWLYNGNAAPPTFTTTTNSISLSPSGSVSPSNVAVTVTLDGTSYPNLVSTVTQNINFSISGDNAVCATSNNYTISNLPSGATVQWQASPAATVTVNSRNTQQTTLTKNNNGIITLTAVISNACSASPITINKSNIAVGTPAINTGYNDGSGTVIGTEESPEINTVCQINFPTQVHTNLEIPGAATVTWTKVQDINGRVTWSQYDANNISLSFRLAGQSGLFQVDATNGCGTTTKQYIFASESCGLMFSVSPNPASSTATVSA